MYGEVLSRLADLRLANRHPNGSDAGSEEKKMSSIVLSKKAVRLLELCEAEGFEPIGDLLEVVCCDSVYPAICMECGATTQLKPDQHQDYCERCRNLSVVTGLVLAGLIKEAAMALYRNYYWCVACGGLWTDEWSAQCDDDCPYCGARHMSPYKSEDVEEGDDE